MVDSLLENISHLIEGNVSFTPLLALLGGIITSITPCALSSVPLVIGYVGGAGNKNTKKSFILSLIFVAGSAITFTILGVIAAGAGKLIGVQAKWWYILLGILMIVMTLQIWEIITIIPSTNLLSKNKKKGAIGALLVGILSGIFSSPCATPVLVVLLGVLAQGNNMIMGIVSMLCYAVGHGALTVLAGTAVGFVEKLNSSRSFAVFSRILKMIMGIGILAIGLYMIYLGI